MVALLVALGCWFALSILLTVVWALAHRVVRRAPDDAAPPHRRTRRSRRAEGPAAGDPRLSLTRQ
jgi:hypothetical protein